MYTKYCEITVLDSRQDHVMHRLEFQITIIFGSAITQRYTISSIFLDSHLHL